LTGFLKRDFRQKKGHQLLNFGESQLMARKEASEGKNPLKPLFIFYRIFPEKSTNKDQASRKRFRLRSLSYAGQDAVTGRR